MLIQFGKSLLQAIAIWGKSKAIALFQSKVSSRPTPIDPQTLTERWVVSPEVAHHSIEQGATLLDARPCLLQHLGMLEGSISVSWQQFSQSQNPDRGKLLEDQAELTQKLREVGIKCDRPVMVIADPLQGWGEDGRIVWMLRTLGHPQAMLVDGGYPALVKTGIPVTLQVQTKAAEPGDFTIKHHSQWEINRNQLKNALSENHLVIIDTREPREYQGKTPYGESRGGHIPGAVHLYYKELLDRKGYLLPPEEIFSKLQARGISPNASIVSYCTGGIRSGWLTAVLANLGFSAKNYPGSMWEWSAAPETDYPLE